MKKTLSLFLSLILVIYACLGLTGCGRKDTVDPEKASDLSICMITDKNGLGDEGLNDSCLAGLNKAAEEHTNLTVEVVEPTTDYATAIADAVKLDPDIILCVSGDMGEVLKAVAPEYEDEVFIIFDADVPDQFNVTSVKFNPEQQAYLAGAVAALTTQNNVAGFIADEENELNVKYLYGFTGGVVSTNKKCYTTTNYIGAGATSRQAKETSVAQFKLGADIIFSVLSSSTREGTLKAADERRFKVVSLTSSADKLHEGSVLAAVQKNGEQVCYTIANRIINGTFDGSTIYFNMASDAFMITNPSGIITEKQMEKLTAISEGLKDGTVMAPYDYNTYTAFINGTAFAPSDAEQIAAQQATIEALEAINSGKTAEGGENATGAAAEAGDASGAAVTENSAVNTQN